eukprot:SAG11_NODE_503_length_8890_cov_30.658628_3_plen_276_part_00
MQAAKHMSVVHAGVLALVLIVWDSPLLASTSAITALGLLYLHHSGQWRWVATETAIGGMAGFTRALGDGTLLRTLDAMRGGWGTVLRVGGVVAKVVGPLLVGTKSHLVAAVDGGEIASPRLAWLAWLVVVTATKMRREIRLKTLIWPFIALWATSLPVGAAAQLQYVLLGVLLWAGAAGSAVHLYEERQAARVGAAWGQREATATRQREATAASATTRVVAARDAPVVPAKVAVAKAPEFADQTECALRRCLVSVELLLSEFATALKSSSNPIAR